VIPKNLQSWVWLALLLLVAVGIFFSGTTKKPAHGNAQAPLPSAPVTAAGLTPEQVQRRLEESEDEARRHGLAPTTPGRQHPPGDPQYNPDAAYGERKHDAHIVRYADDFVILCKRQPEFFLAEAKKVLDRLGLTLNAQTLKRRRLISLDTGSLCDLRSAQVW
jgi:hypothetical protein